MISRKGKRVFLGLAFGFLALGLFITILNRYFAELELRQRLEEERAEIREPVPLIHTVERGTETRVRRFAARLEPWSDAAVAAEVAGRVDEILVDPGDPVEAGDVMVRMEDTLARTSLRIAEASLEIAEARLREFERQRQEAERLAASRAVPESTLMEARSRVEVKEKEIARLEGEIEQARENLRRHEVRAPFAGAAAERLIETGDAVTAYQPVIGLAALDPMRVVFYVGDREASFLEGRAEVLLTLAGEDGPLPVEVRNIAPVANRQTGTFRVEGRLPNPDNRLRGGIRGVVEAVIGIFEDHLFVPATAVRYEGGQAYVDLLGGADEATNSRPIEVGPEIGGRYPVISGLNEGDRIVVR